MPYITKESRDNLDSSLEPLLEILKGAQYSLTPGEINYVLTKVVHAYLSTELNYYRLNSMIGALECCKMELYRRIAVPYEDRKIAENGDIMPLKCEDLQVGTRVVIESEEVVVVENNRQQGTIKFRPKLSSDTIFLNQDFTLASCEYIDRIGFYTV